MSAGHSDAVNRTQRMSPGARELSLKQGFWIVAGRETACENAIGGGLRHVTTVDHQPQGLD